MIPGLWTPDRGLPDGARADAWLREQRRRERYRWRHVRDQRVDRIIEAAAPTLVDVQSSNFGDTSTASEVTPSLTWPAAGVVLVFGLTEDNTAVTLNLPTFSGGTFTAINVTNTGSNGKVYAWSATTVSGGSGAITATIPAPEAGTPRQRGIIAFSYSGSDGIGANALMASTATTNAVQALTRTQANSAIGVGMVDWNAVNDVAVATNPVGGTVRVIQTLASHSTMYVGSWADEGATGTTSYGIGSYTATAKWIGLVVEVKGTAGGATNWGPWMVNGLSWNRLVGA